MKTASVKLDTNRILHIAWEGDDYATDWTEDDAVSKLAARGLPEGFHAKLVKGMIDADDYWKVWHSDSPGLDGTGGTPEDAYKDWEKNRTTTWWPGRFNSMVATVRLAIQNSPEHDKADIDAEFSTLIRDIRDGRFKYLG